MCISKSALLLFLFHNQGLEAITQETTTSVDAEERQVVVVGRGELGTTTAV